MRRTLLTLHNMSHSDNIYNPNTTTATTASDSGNSFNNRGSRLGPAKSERSDYLPLLKSNTKIMICGDFVVTYLNKKLCNGVLHCRFKRIKPVTM